MTNPADRDASASSACDVAGVWDPDVAVDGLRSAIFAAIASTGGEWRDDPSIVARWAEAEAVTLPERSGGVSVRAAVTVLTGFRDGRVEQEWEQAAVGALATAGVSLADAVAVQEAGLASDPLVHVTGGKPASPELEFALHAVVTPLQVLTRHYPHMDVGDALGWLLTNPTILGGQRDIKRFIGRRLSRWNEVGLVGRGWVYAAAGYTPGEARAGLDAGTLTEDGVRAVAALRGVPLPA